MKNIIYAIILFRPILTQAQDTKIPLRNYVTEVRAGKFLPIAAPLQERKMINVK